MLKFWWNFNKFEGLDSVDIWCEILIYFLGYQSTEYITALLTDIVKVTCEHVVVHKSLNQSCI